MKRSEMVVLILGAIITFLFVGFMFDYYLKIQQTQGEKRHIYYDSVIIAEQRRLKANDSILRKLILEEAVIVEEKINHHHSAHDKRVTKILQKLDSVKKKK